MRAPSQTSRIQPDEARIPGLPDEATSQVLERIVRHRAVQRVVLYGSRALGRHQGGSDIDLCLEAPGMGLGELLELGAEIDDLLLPWKVDLQLRHQIDHAPLLDHIGRAGRVLWERTPEP
jgi:predicted nucleotidyltransferase